MENNKFSLSVGDTAILDKGCGQFQQEVTILFMTEPTQLFSDVIELGKTEKFSVMTKRLTPKG